MKKRTILALLCLPFLLAGCSEFEAWSLPNSSSSQEQSESIPSSESESESESQSSSSEVVENKVLKSISKDFIKTSYYTGDTYSSAFEVRVLVKFTDGTSTKITEGFDVSITSFVSVDGYECSQNAPILRAGQYTSKVKVSYTLNNVTKSFTTSETNTFNSVLEEGDDECVSFEATMLNSYGKNEIVANKLHIRLDIVWRNHGQELYFLTDNNGVANLTLYSDAQQTGNIINNPLTGGTTYHLVVTIGNVSQTLNFELASAYEKVDKSDLTLVAHDVDSYNSPIVENPKILVIPINLTSSSASNVTNWTTTKLNNLQDYYFGNSATSFTNYYKSMSHGYMNFTGIVSQVYEETNENYTVEKINNDSTYATLYGMMRRALNFVKSNTAYRNVDWSEYDQDNNGTFDNIHLLTNYNANTWAGPLWPHKSSTDDTSGTHSNPVINTYSIGAINHTSDSITQIHEQGHIFGLDDYYDYSDNGMSEINYVGGADMQSHNMFDWNSYSKLSVGLVSPYVITGGDDDFTIEIGDAVTTGDCILVPANYDTWNGSAFDEYFLIELFSNKGLNSEFWNSWSRYYGNLGEYGIRLYHVDSRLYNYNTGREASIDSSTWGNSLIAIGPNNSSDYTACGYGQYNPSACADMKLLTLIQKGGTDTFGSENGRHYLNSSDLFQTGDTFTFSTYSKFLSKAGYTKTKMDNGETFPWKIDFESVTLNSARLRFYK